MNVTSFAESCNISRVVITAKTICNIQSQNNNSRNSHNHGYINNKTNSE